MPNLVWRVKLVAEFETGETTEVEVARLERDEQARLIMADPHLGLATAWDVPAGTGWLCTDDPFAIPNGASQCRTRPRDSFSNPVRQTDISSVCFRERSDRHG